MRENRLDRVGYLRLVHQVRSLRQYRFLPMLAREGSKRPIVSREARTAVARTSSQIVRRDPLVRAERCRDCIDVRSRDLFADGREAVGEADLHRHVRVDTQLRDLGADDRHPRDIGSVLAHTVVDLDELLTGEFIALTD